MDLSVVILNYNTVDLSRNCLRTLFASKLGKYSMEIIVCDNGSHDSSVAIIRKEFPKVTIIENKKNLGFAAGNNPGIKRARGRYILLLNSDTEAPKNTLRIMIEFMDKHPDIGASSCKLLLSDGSMDPACHRGFPTPWASFTYLAGFERLFPKIRLLGQYHQGYKDFQVVHDVDCISGAFFLVRGETIKDVGLLDEDYFMYAEDIDWCYRMKHAGWRIMFNPAVSILHKKKQSGRAHESKKMRLTTEMYFHKYNWLFYKKHYANKYGTFLTLFVNAFYATRLFLLEKFSL